MKRCAAAILATFAAAIAAAPSALADAVTPQSGATCGPANSNAQTFSPQGVLLCQGTQWQQVGVLQPPVDAIYTYGPSATLTDTDVIPGATWVGIPVMDNGTCIAEQTAAAPPEVHSNNAGQYFDFGLKTGLTSLKLSGYCNWKMVRV